MALLNATRAAERLGVSRRALGRKAPHLEAAYAAITEVQITNAEQVEAMARQEVEAMKAMCFKEMRRTRDQLLNIPARIAADRHAQPDSGAVCFKVE